MVFKMGVFLIALSILMALMQPSTAASVQRRDAAVVKGDKVQHEAEGPKPEPEFDTGDAENAPLQGEKSHDESGSVLRDAPASATVPGIYTATLFAAITTSMMFHL